MGGLLFNLERLSFMYTYVSTLVTYIREAISYIKKICCICINVLMLHPPPHSLVYISTEKKMFLINVQRILNKFRKWNTFEFPVSSKLL